MFKTIADPADCEVRSVIRFLKAKKVKPAEIHRQLVEIYGGNVMTDGMVRKWVRQFNDGRTNVHDEARSGRPSVVNDAHDCPANKEFGTFGDCPPSCLKNPPNFCTLRLNYGCKCKKGFVLTKYKDYNSDCVKPEDCPQ
ncbi:hypothetical protein AVEN_193748-1 [Araneus ventricosus]|uniref:Uncharacterized protein n=1 Tax=Araneus ventricosus TaxID=182803 RepID=A0A4Y2DN55_ARAVE|nr:hypothetical protein AVEN_193748-1 [Araneus ventricosus]